MSYRPFILLILFLVAGAPKLVAQDAGRQHPPRKKFAVVADRSDEGRNASAYCENIIQRTGVAELVRDPQNADFILRPLVRIRSRVTRVDHTIEVEKEKIDASGKKKTEKSSRTVHQDDRLTVTVSFTCSIERTGKSDLSNEIMTVEGTAAHSTSGPDATGHRSSDHPIRYRNDQVARVESEMGTPDDNSGQPALYRAIFSLCNVIGRVLEVDTQNKRLKVDLGSDDGIQAKDDPDGVTEMEIFVKTGDTSGYSFLDPQTGIMFFPDKSSAEAAPGKPADWAYRQEEALSKEKAAIIRGLVVDRLIPIGTRVSSWAEVQDLGRETCTITPKKKGDFGRTQDDDKVFASLAKLPDRDKTPIIVRVRAKRGFLHK